jgi:hypothetical protein
VGVQRTLALVLLTAGCAEAKEPAVPEARACGDGVAIVRQCDLGMSQRQIDVVRITSNLRRGAKSDDERAIVGRIDASLKEIVLEDAATCRSFPCAGDKYDRSLEATRKLHAKLDGVLGRFVRAIQARDEQARIAALGEAVTLAVPVWLRMRVWAVAAIADVPSEALPCGFGPRPTKDVVVGPSAEVPVGARLTVRVQVNAPAYVYVARESSEALAQLFPKKSAAPELEKPGITREVMDGCIEGAPREERLFVVASLAPLPALDKAQLAMARSSLIEAQGDGATSHSLVAAAAPTSARIVAELPLKYVSRE